MEIRGPNNKQPVDPSQGAQPVGPAGETSAADKAKFKEAMGGAAPVGAGSAGQPQIDALKPNFEKLSSRIKQVVDEGQDKQTILKSVISEQLNEQFGSAATPMMTDAVTEKFLSDPQLSQLFNRLYTQATK